jgi:hypothetical protein
VGAAGLGARRASCWVLKEQTPLGGGSFGWWPHLWSQDVVPVRCVWWWVMVAAVWGCGVAFVENCTVDASIFVVKLLRAHGGCLGTRSR